MDTLDPSLRQASSNDRAVSSSNSVSEGSPEPRPMANTNDPPSSPHPASTNSPRDSPSNPPPMPVSVPVNGHEQQQPPGPIPYYASAPPPTLTIPLPSTSSGSGNAPGTSGRGGRGRRSDISSEDWTRQRKDNHKEVERRRRGTINDGISELARIVPNSSGGEKAKGAILNRAVNYIHQLKENEARNIEKWTLEKLLMDQAMGDLQVQLEETKNNLAAERRKVSTLQRELAVLGGTPLPDEGEAAGSGSKDRAPVEQQPYYPATAVSAANTTTDKAQDNGGGGGGGENNGGERSKDREPAPAPKRPRIE